MTPKIGDDIDISAVEFRMNRAEHERQLALAVNAERERCAQIAEDMDPERGSEIAKRIRDVSE